MKGSQTNNEQALLQQVAAGSEAAFAALVDIHWPRVFGHALAYVKTMHTAEELAQDVFMDLWNSRERLPELDHFANYLFILTRNRTFKALRKKLEETADVSDEHRADDAWLPDHFAEYRETQALLQKGIASLPPARRQVFTLSRIEGKSYEEICQELGISRNTVKEHIVKSLNFLRHYMAQHGHPLLLVSAMIASLPSRPNIF